MFCFFSSGVQTNNAKFSRLRCLKFRFSKVVIMAGAGISVSANLPDFRSKGGLHDQLRHTTNITSPETIFTRALIWFDSVLFKSLWFVVFWMFPSLDRLAPMRASRVERELCQASFSEKIHSCSSKWRKSSEWMRSTQLWRMHSSRFCRTSACCKGPCIVWKRQYNVW